MKKLDQKQSDVIKRGLQGLIDNSSVTESGSLQLKSPVLFYIAEEILNSYFPFDKNIPERTRREILNKAVIRWMKYKGNRDRPNRIYAFQRAVETELRSISRKQSCYTVLMFLNIDPLSLKDLQNNVLLGDSFQFLSWQELSEMEIDSLWKEVHSHDEKNPILWDFPELTQAAPDTGKFYPIIIKINTFGPDAAVEIASERVDVSRCFLNISAVLGQFTYFRSEPKALSMILPSPIYGVINQEGKLVSTYFTTEKYQYKKERISAEQKKSFEYLLLKYKDLPDPNSSWFYVLDTLRQYQKALDITVPESAYLAMWQVLENGVEFGEKWEVNRDIEALVSVLVPLDPLLKTALRMLTEHRNAFVHSGVFPEQGDKIFFTLKIITDVMIRSLISLADRFSTTAELKEYIRYSNLGDSDLERKKLVISKIEQSRKVKENHK